MKRVILLVLGLLSCSQIENVEFVLVKKTPMVRVPRDEACLLRCDDACDRCLAENEDAPACEAERETCYAGCGPSDSPVR